MIGKGMEKTLATLADSLHQDSIDVSDTTIITKDSVDIPVPIDSANNTFPDTVGTNNLHVSISGDEFTFIPSIVDSASSSGLLIRIISAKIYPCLNSRLNNSAFHSYANDRNFQMHIYDITQPGAKYCEEGEERVSGSTSIYPLDDGVSNLEVSVNGVTYKGTVTKTSNSYEIKWPYTTGIKFSQLILTK